MNFRTIYIKVRENVEGHSTLVDINGCLWGRGISMFTQPILPKNALLLWQFKHPHYYSIKGNFWFLTRLKNQLKLASLWLYRLTTLYKKIWNNSLWVKMLIKYFATIKSILTGKWRSLLKCAWSQNVKNVLKSIKCINYS